MSFEDDDEEVGERFEVNEVDASPTYDINKYSSNDVRQKPLSFADDDDSDDEEGGGSVMHRKAQQARGKPRYGGDSTRHGRAKKPEVLGVTGVNFDSDEEKDGRYNEEPEDEDDYSNERGDAFSLDELDGWMSKINQRQGEKATPDED